MIQLNNLERSYKTPAGQFFVLRRVNLGIREGEFITIMGPSGAGKSSILNVLALLDVVAGPVEAGIDQGVGDDVKHVVLADQVGLKTREPAVARGKDA